MKILVIDADYLTQIVLTKIFNESTKAQLLFFSSQQEEFYNIVQKENIRVVIINFKKGKQHKFSILEYFRKRDKNIGMIVIGEPSHRYFLGQTVGIGKVGYLTKPFSKDEIIQLVSKYLLENEINPFEESAQELILKKDFMLVYQSLEKFQERIQESYFKDSLETKSQLNTMCDTMLTMMNCTDEKYRKKYKTKMFFSDKIIKDKFLLQFMLFDLFKEIYRQRSIQKRPQLYQLFDYIDQSIYQELSLSEASRCCDVSQSYLSRVLKENYGLGFNNYIHIEKMILAKRAFYYNDDKIIDVSFQLAYGEPSYFCKVFKRIEGQTPTLVKEEMDKERNLQR
ncbi:helix-turn-helix domain-containing protein [Vagococcus sp.]|uniref:helix-turn-helix domain-containing protein n=1 Tax=Vagococcus sp. TaxID=1933889 RepID=UPI003F94C16F